jgi:hypothetical protein
MTQFAPAPGDLPGRPEAIAEVHVLWLTAGLGCDGDTIAVTGATQPIAVITKLDLAEAVEFDAAAADKNIRAVRPGMPVLSLSAKTGPGMAEFLEFLEARRRNRQAVALSPVLPVR